MLERIKSKTALALIAAAVAALGVGGVALAQNASTGTPSQHEKSSAETADEQGGAPDNSASDSDSVQNNAQDEETNDQPGDDASSEHGDKAVQQSSAHEKEDPGTDQGEK
jgi:hypothetical protein